MSETPLVRPFRQSDLERVLEIERASFEEPYGADVFARLLAGPNVFLVVEQLGEPAGYLVAVPEGPTLHVVSVAVHPKWRRKGFATRLFEALFAKARAQGVQSVVLEVDTQNQEAQKLYRRLGFAETAKIKHYYSNGHDALVMEKKL